MTERDMLFRLGDRRQVELGPSALLEQAAGQVILVQPLLDYDNCAGLLRIEP
jgi:hypothetical protein